MVSDLMYMPILKRKQLNPLSDERPGAAKWNTARSNIIANGYVEATPITGLSLRAILEQRLLIAGKAGILIRFP